MNLHCCVDGFNGHDASDGLPGSAGWTGEGGGDGFPASSAQPGGHAGDIEVQLVSSVAGGYAWVAVTGQAGTSPVNFMVSDENVGEFILSAKGGRGGNGAAGGRGGDGGHGWRGKDATREFTGSGGGNGGDGGAGGLGSHGAAGGHAGDIAIHVAEENMYLLTALAGATAPSTFVQGGAGGMRGGNGQGGSGGTGGAGGAAYNWAVLGSPDRNGVALLTTHCSPGGSRGDNGSNGISPQMPLLDGAQGDCGSFAILTHYPNGQVCEYSHRFDLELSSFILQKVGPDADGEFEFGETVHATGFCVQNIGGMPTPSLQRQRLDLTPGNFVRPVRGDSIFLPRHAPIGSGEERDVDGILRFQIGFPTDDRMDFDPVVVTEVVAPRAFQLGIETEDHNGLDTGFQREFSNFNYGHGHTLIARYPIQNTGGILGARSLAAGEWTRIELRLDNVSNLPFGNARRRVRVEFQAAQGDNIHAAPLRLRFRGADTVLPAADGGDVDLMSGHFLELEHIDPRGSTNICGEVGFHTDMPLYGYAELRAAIYIEDLNVKGSWRCVQRRALPLRCEPNFDPKSTTRAILVCGTGTKQETFKDWQELLTKKYCFDTAVFSISKYGHFDPSKPMTSYQNALSLEFPCLGNFLAGRLIVILDDKFTDSSLGETLVRPSALLSSWHFSSYFGPEPPHYLVVAEPGTEPALDHLVYPLPSAALPLKRRHTYDSVEDWIKANANANATSAISEVDAAETQWKRSSDPMLEFDVITVHGCKTMWSHGQTEKCRTDALNKKADHVVDYIKKWRPDLQNAIVVPHINSAKFDEPAKGSTATKTRKMGEIHVFGTRGMGGVQGRLTCATRACNMTGAASLFAVARALAPKEKISTLVELIHGSEQPTASFEPAAALSGEDASEATAMYTRSTVGAARFRVTRALAHSLCADIVDEYLRLLEAGPRLPSGMMLRDYKKRYLSVANDYMPTLKMMVESASLHAAMPHANPYIPAFIVGSLEALAHAPGLTLWFAPLGRQRKLGRLLEWAASELKTLFGCDLEGAKVAAEQCLREIDSLRVQQGLPLVAVRDKNRQKAASVCQRFSSASLVDVDSVDCCDVSVVRGVAKGATKMLANEFDKLRKKESERDVELQKLFDVSTRCCEDPHLGETTEAQAAESSIPVVASWPAEPVESFSDADGAVPAWACFDDFHTAPFNVTPFPDATKKIQEIRSNYEDAQIPGYIKIEG